jgi:putative endonuclease
MRTDTLDRTPLDNTSLDHPPLDHTPPTPDRPDAHLGPRGEDLAADYLTQRGLVVLSRNWRCRDGELDIVATDGASLVVCEVKTRTTGDFGDPAEFVDNAKTKRIRRATHAWLKQYHVGWCEIRFDVITVVWPVSGLPRLRHLRGAF